MRIFKIANVVSEQMTTFAMALFFLFMGNQIYDLPEGVHSFMSGVVQWGVVGLIACVFFLLFATGYKIFKLAEDPEVDRVI